MFKVNNKDISGCGIDKRNIIVQFGQQTLFFIEHSYSSAGDIIITWSLDSGKSLYLKLWIRNDHPI